MGPLEKFKREATIAVSVAVLMLCTQCKTTSSYKDIEYDPAKLKTPSGHGLEKKEYPFDDGGNYRKDWVKNNERGRTSSSFPQMQSTAEPSVASETQSSAQSYPTLAEASAERASTERATSVIDAGAMSTAPPSVSVAPSSTTAQYHKVEVGDTLFALSKRYSTSVEELQRVNGLTDNTIHVGQSLRIP